MAYTTQGNLRLIYVRPGAFGSPELEPAQQKESERKLKELAAGVPLPESRVSCLVRLGSVYDEILREAESIKADLIIVGSHRPTMTRYLLGSNAANIVRHARCSVLVVR